MHIESSYDPRGQILTEKSINFDPGSFSEMQDLTEIFGVSSTIDMDSSRELECSDKHCVIFLVDPTCYLLFNPVFGVTIGHRLISIEYFEKSGSRSGSARYMDIQSTMIQLEVIKNDQSETIN